MQILFTYLLSKSFETVRKELVGKFKWLTKYSKKISFHNLLNEASNQVCLQRNLKNPIYSGFMVRNSFKSGKTEKRFAH